MALVSSLKLRPIGLHRAVRCRHGEEGPIDIGGGESIRIPRKKTGYRPRIDLTKEQAVELQLEALQRNCDPYSDHGVEVLYRFAHIDPFRRSKYFGVLHTQPYTVLINHTSAELLSALQVSEFVWKQRVRVHHKYRLNESAVFEFTMIQKLGGFYDSYFFTESLLRQ